MPHCKHCGVSAPASQGRCFPSDSNDNRTHEFLAQASTKREREVDAPPQRYQRHPISSNFVRHPISRNFRPEGHPDPYSASQSEIITGWHSTAPCPNQKFEEGVESKDGRLFYFGIDLAQLADGIVTSGPKIPGQHFGLELIYLPAIRARVKQMVDVFERVSAKLNYAGSFTYCYASKANAAEEVMRAAREGGAHQETSACYDLHVMLKDPELLPKGRKLIANGFKFPGSTYSQLLCELLLVNPDVIPIIEDVAEVDVYAQLKATTGRKIQVGIRIKCWGPFESVEEMTGCDCRFGFTPQQAEEVACRIAATDNLELKVLHAMVGSPVPKADIHKMVPPMQIYADFKKKFPTLDTFDFGGGTPAAFVLSEVIDYEEYVTTLLQTVQGECDKHGVPVPHLIGEFGRYTVSNHGVHVFSVGAVRPNGGPVPYYIINGSVMSCFPDTWALKEHFTCLPLNHLDKPFTQSRIGGLTCDSGDMYPPLHTDTKLFLPQVETKDNLWVGFFNIGAYQEMLGGVGGAKHCGIPESDELCIDIDEKGNYVFEIYPGQTLDDVCKRLGYQFARKHQHARGVKVIEGTEDVVSVREKK